MKVCAECFWGEIWSVPDKIRKNGRLGQSQAGVDVYGRPKRQEHYSGIQCKGKDDFLKKRLTQSEVDNEIAKAQTFLPKLETFIIATTAEKDVEIEQYIREKDVESRAKGGFEILLFDWEDISDRIEVHRDTFNYYVLNNQFKSNFDFSLIFEDGKEEFTVQPTYYRTIIKYGLKTDSGFEAAEWVKQFPIINVMDYLFPKKMIVKKSWVTLKRQFINTGERVIEDYKLYLYPEKEKKKHFW